MVTLSWITVSRNKPLRIGGSTSGPAWGNYKFAGIIDEPAVYGGALSAGEISAIYAAGSLGKCVVDSDADGMADSWEIINFGNLNQNASGDYDGDGELNIEEYTSGREPNDITFSVSFASDNVNSTQVSGTFQILAGVPAQMAFLVDSTNYAAASWSTYSQSFTLNLPAPDGRHTVWVGLRGLSDGSNQTWENAIIVRDTAGPSIIITNPVNATTSRPVIQLQGYSLEPLSSLRCDVNNAAGIQTDLEGFVVHQHYDAAIGDFTTNFFQCFDIELTNGLNTVTLHAKDLAGNTTAVVRTYTLDYSGATAPVLTMYWPQTGAQVSGDTITLRGMLDDPTASVTAEVAAPDGTTDVVEATVERNGLVWIEAFPIYGGADTISLTTSNAAGMVIQSSLVVTKSTSTMVISGVPDSELNKTTTSVTVSTVPAGYTVWVNGKKAYDNGGGVWTASDVPIPAGGTAVFEARAIPNSDNSGNGSGGGGGTTYQNLGNPSSAGAITAELQKDVPPIIYGETYQDVHRNDVFSLDLLARDQARHMYSTNGWVYNSGGTMTETEDYDYWPSPNPEVTHSEGHYTWPADPSWFPALPGTVTFSDNVNGTTGPFTVYPDLAQEHCLVGDFQVYGDGSWGSLYSRAAHTVMKLKTGGKSALARNNLFMFPGEASEILEKRWRPQTHWSAESRPIAPELITIGSLGNLGADTYLFKALPDNQVIEVTPRIKGKPFYTFGLNQVKYTLSITANGRDLERNPEFCVGQKVTFDAHWSPTTPYGVVSSTHDWVVSQKYINETWQHSRWITVSVDPPFEVLEYYGSINYRVNPDLLKVPSPFAWWISGGSKNCKLVLVLTMGNGQMAKFDIRGRFTIYRPVPVISRRYEQGLPQVLWAEHWSYVLENGTLKVGDAASGNHEMNFSATIPSRYEATAKWTQIIDVDFTGAGYIDGMMVLNPRYTGVLDNQETFNGEWPIHNIENPTGNINLITLNDAPQASSYPTLSGKLRLIGTFTDYLMFKPDGDGIFVPLGKTVWSVNASASWPSDSITPSDLVPGPSELDGAADFPEWTSVFTNPK